MYSLLGPIALYEVSKYLGALLAARLASARWLSKGRGHGRAGDEWDDRYACRTRQQVGTRALWALRLVTC